MKRTRPCRAHRRTGTRPPSPKPAAPGQLAARCRHLPRCIERESRGSAKLPSRGSATCLSGHVSQDPHPGHAILGAPNRPCRNLGNDRKIALSHDKRHVSLRDEEIAPKRRQHVTSLDHFDRLLVGCCIGQGRRASPSAPATLGGGATDSRAVRSATPSLIALKARPGLHVTPPARPALSARPLGSSLDGKSGQECAGN